VVLAPSGDRVSLEEAALMLGCEASAVRQLMTIVRSRHGHVPRESELLRSTVEEVATEVYSWRLHTHDPDAYWLTGKQAARVLGVSRARLSQLAADNRVPFVRHQDGTRLYRRRQLERIAGSAARSRASAPGDTGW
jgi:excisionase family DNA binding protein